MKELPPPYRKVKGEKYVERKPQPVEKKVLVPTENGPVSSHIVHYAFSSVCLIASGRTGIASVNWSCIPLVYLV